MADKVPGWKDGEFGHKLGELINTIIDLIKQTIKGEIEAREEFTQRIVAGLNDANPYCNYVICHQDWSLSGAGEGESGSSDANFDVWWWPTVHYDVLWFKHGTFQRSGEGGYANWAYYGNVIERDGGRVKFGDRY